MAAARGWALYQLDVNNAFLQEDLAEEVYMTVPQGVPNPSNKVYRLGKSLYGLKQASKQWFQKLSTTLLSLGYQQSKNDYSLFLNKSSTHITIIVVYVDDILRTGSNKVEIDHVKHHLDQCFGIKDLGSLHYFLGLEVSYLPEGIVLSQHKFTQKLLHDAAISTLKPVATPLPLNCKLTANEGSPLADPTHYRVLMGNLNILSHTRPD